MCPIQDDFYLSFGTKVFGLNLRKFKTENLEQYISNLNNIKQVQYIKFVIEQP